MGITRFEITGGGEPFLNDNLSYIVNTIKEIIPNSYIKLYTNGFILKEAGNIDELDISLVSDDDSINMMQDENLKNEIEDEKIIEVIDQCIMHNA